LSSAISKIHRYQFLYFSAIYGKYPVCAAEKESAVIPVSKGSYKVHTRNWYTRFQEFTPEGTHAAPRDVFHDFKEVSAYGKCDCQTARKKCQNELRQNPGSSGYAESD
jgi:hypothetical protein